MGALMVHFGPTQNEQLSEKRPRLVERMCLIAATNHE